jgi:hypothetical protein
MGLDMYLEVRRNVRTQDWGADFETIQNEQGQAIVSASDMGSLLAKDSFSVSVESTAIYWRKVNAIHQWFVDNLANGVDECQRIPVRLTDLEDLRDLVKDVLIHKDKAPVALPTASGFFFGNTEYNEYYWSDLQYTAEELDRVIANSTPSDDFYYQASW